MKIIITERQQDNLIDSYLEKYIESGCVSIKKLPKYIVINVESPSYFEEFGFDKNDPAKIKSLLKKNSFQYAFGEYIKEI